MKNVLEPEHVPTVVIGGGQAGLSVGYHLSKRGLPFLILDAHERVGDAWRKRWDSLRLFSPAWADGLDGMPFPASRYYFPTKDEMGDYLEAYANRFELPVKTSTRVDSLKKNGKGFVISSGDRRFTADNVVVAMATFQRPKVPAFASGLDPRIVQVHANDYHNPSQLKEGKTLIVGAGNSGADIAMELAAAGHTVWLSGRDTGHVPFRIESFKARFLMPLVARVIFHRVLTVKTPIGRKARPKILSRGGPLVRVKPSDLSAAGVVRTTKTVGTRDGMPVLEDGQVLDVDNVVWCTGFHPGFSWIDLPVLGAHEPMHKRGVVESEPGLYFVGLEFLYALSSIMVHGVGRDAKYIAKQIESRSNGARHGAEQA